MVNALLKRWVSPKLYSLILQDPAGSIRSPWPYSTFFCGVCWDLTSLQMSHSDCSGYVSSELVTQASQDSYKTGWQMSYLVSMGRAVQGSRTGSCTLFLFLSPPGGHQDTDGSRYYCILTQDNCQVSAGQISHPLTVLFLDSTGNHSCLKNLYLYPKFFARFSETWPQRRCYKPCRLQ